MIKINALAFLFIMQFLLMFLGAAIFLFLQNRKLRLKEVIANGEINRLRDELDNMEKQTVELTVWKDMFDNLEKKFEQIRNVNAKLKESLARLIPEAERSKEYEQLIAEIERNNQELDSCIGTLQKENEQLSQQTKSFKRDLDKLSQKLTQTVSIDAYNNLKAQKKSLELKVESLKNELKQKTKEHENLQKSYVWLEKEYNALYKNISDEQAASSG